MSNMSMRIEFSTNAKQVQAQIEKLSHATTKLSQQAKFVRALDTNKASARELTGQLSGRKAILKLEEQIATEAQRRMKMVASGYRFGTKEQDKYVRGLIQQNEVMRIRTKILNDNATAMVNLGKNTQWAGRQLVVGFTVPLTIAAGAAMKAFSSLEKELIKFKRVYGDVATSGDELKAVAAQVRALAVEWTKYGVAVSDTIDLAAQAAGAGFTGNQLITQINSATKLAVLGELEKQKSMKATIALQSTFKMSNEELAQSINYLNQLENSTMVTMDDMATAIPKAATVVQGLGGTIKDLGTFMAALEEGGVTAAEGANALKSGLGSLLNPSKAASEQLAAIGVNMDTLWQKSEDNGRGVISVVEELGVALDKLGQTQRQRVIEELFGKHQFARMNALLANINTGAQAGQAKDVAKTGQLESALVAQQELAKLGESSLTKFQASVEKLKASIAPLGEQVMQFVTPLVEFATKLIDKFNSMPEVFKKVGVGIVAGLGVVAPLALMLLGQFQNLLGNGMKLVNWMSAWGKNTKWVSIENLTLADALGGVNAQLIAENALLTTNQQSWAKRNAAAAGAAAGSLGSRLRFATGGNVPGTGNGDTIPALLTPGEFVVKKSVAQRFGNILNAMNSGKLQGFAKGKFVASRTVAAEKSSKAQDKIGALQSEQEVTALKNQSYKNLMAFKAREQKFIASQANQLGFKYDKRFDQWDQSHVGFADARYLSQLSDAEVMKAFATGGIPSEKIKALKTVDKPWNYKGDLVMDNHLINYALPGMMDHPLNPLEVGKIKAIADKRSATDKSAANTMTSLIAGWRASGPGKRFYTHLLDDNFLFMNLVSKLQKGGGQVNLPRAGLGFNKIAAFATGGWVPGTGNRDSVPAVLTPGEAVIKKSAAAKFRPVLNAMNNGTLGMFAEGKTDAGYRGSLGSDERRALLDPARESMDTFLEAFKTTFNIGTKKMKSIKAVMEKDLVEQTRAAHIVPIVDSLGRKVYDDRALVGTTRRENESMKNYGTERNSAVLQRVNNETAKSAEHLAARNAILDKLIAGEHIIVQEERDLLQELLVETEQKRLANKGNKDYRLSKTLRGTEGMATAAGLSHTPLVFSTKEKATAESAVVAKRVQAEHTVDGADGTPTGKTGSRFDPYALMMMLTMFSGEITGITDKLGAFGKALTAALPALMTMQMMGFSPKLNIKGMRGGAQATGRVASIAESRAGSFIGGAAGKFGKFGLGAAAGYGVLGAIGGSLIGNKISDNKGGTRDAAGQAVSWGATGAGIGMMFGPWGAAIGAAVGALAGFTVSTIKSRKELDKSIKTMEKSSEAWKAIGDQLTEKYQIGGNKDLQTFLTDVTGLNDKQTEMFQLLRKDMADDTGPWSQRIKDLATAANKGITNSDTLRSELRGLTLELRGQGVDDDSIETILKAFVTELPGAVTQGVNASNIAVQSTEQILSAIDAQIGNIGAYEKTSISRGLSTGLGTSSPNVNVPAGMSLGIYAPRNLSAQSRPRAVPQTGGSSSGISTDDLKTMTPVVTNATNALNAAMSSLVQTLINAETNSDEYKQAQADLNKVNEQAAELDKKMRGTVAEGMYLNAAGSGVDKLISAGKGEGLSHEEWQSVLKEDKVNAVQLNQAATALILAGHDLSAFSSVQIAAMGAALIAQQTMIAENKQATADKAETEKALKELSDAAADKAAEEKSKAHDIAQEQKEIKNAKINANLEISRINIENSVLKKFMGEFNSAFGTAVDSFADAQYQIDRIGAKIQSINLKVIAPLQEKADDLRRLNDLDSRKIDKLQKKAQAWDEAQQKRIKKLTEAYDEQAKALERVRQQNEYIANAQRANISLAEALSKGDLAGAANAMVDAAQNQANYAATLNDQKLADAREAALAKEEGRKNPYESQIDAVQARIDARSQKILALEDQIYNIQEKQIEPLQRKADLMNLMLSNTKMEMEYRKANADGIDQENEARGQALENAKEALYDAEHTKTIQDEINETYNKRVKAIADQFKIESTNADVIGEKVKDLDDQHAARITATGQLVADIASDFNEMAAGNNDVIAMWEAKVKKGSIAGVVNDALAYLEQQGEFTTASSKTKEQKLADFKSNQAAVKYAGGEVDGTGGRDSVPVMLTPGEFVMRKSAVRRIGLANLERANMGDQPSGRGGMYKGGQVPNFLGTFGDTIINAAAQKLGVDKTLTATSTSGYPATSLDKGAPSIVGKGANRAVSYLNSMVGASRLPLIGLNSVLNKCLTIVGSLYSRFVGAKTAPSANSPIQRVAGMRRAGIKFNSGYNAPAGAMYWYGGGKYGHVGFADGRGNILGNYGGNVIERRSANLDRPYYGWTTKMNKGGLVPGVGRTDKVPSLLTPGEFVVKKSAVDQIGTAPLKAINKGSLNYTPKTAMAQASQESLVYNDYKLSFAVSGNYDVNQLADVVVSKIERVSDSKIRSRG